MDAQYKIIRVKEFERLNMQKKRIIGSSILAWLPFYVRVDFIKIIKKVLATGDVVEIIHMLTEVAGMPAGIVYRSVVSRYNRNRVLIVTTEFRDRVKTLMSFPGKR